MAAERDLRRNSHGKIFDKAQFTNIYLTDYTAMEGMLHSSILSFMDLLEFITYS